ncbi:MAG: hypothetical protein EHM39_05170, partial [Chloroflexi bacterium]
MRISHTILTLCRGVILAVTLLAALNVTPALAQNPLPPSARLNGLTHEYQDWNHCSGANLTMAMYYYGWPYKQEPARAWRTPTAA